MNHSRVSLQHFQECATSQDCIMNYLKLIVDLHVYQNHQVRITWYYWAWGERKHKSLYRYVLYKDQRTNYLSPPPPLNYLGHIITHLESHVSNSKPSMQTLVSFAELLLLGQEHHCNSHSPVGFQKKETILFQGNAITLQNRNFLLYLNEFDSSNL